MEVPDSQPSLLKEAAQPFSASFENIRELYKRIDDFPSSPSTKNAFLILKALERVGWNALYTCSIVDLQAAKNSESISSKDAYPFQELLERFDALMTATNYFRNSVSFLMCQKSKLSVKDREELIPAITELSQRLQEIADECKKP